MNLAAAAIVAASPQFGSVHVDTGLVAWDGWRGDRQVARVYDVATRRSHELQRIHGLGGALEIEDLDVAASGAAVACVRYWPDRDKKAWRVRVFRRPPGGTWSGAIGVSTASGRWVDDLKCGIGDAGQVSLIWAEGTSGERLKASHVAADGTVEPPVTLAREPIEPALEVAPDGTATAAYRLGADEATVHVAERPATGGWRTRKVSDGGGLELALDATGRPLLAWQSWGEEENRTLSLAAGPDFSPTAFVREGPTNVAALATSTRGDVLFAWTIAAWRRPSPLRVALQRPGGGFSAPVYLGHVAPYPIEAVLGPDGSGVLTYAAGNIDRPRPRLRFLRPDGSWTEPAEPKAGIVGIAPAGPGRFTVAELHARIKKGRGPAYTLRVRELG